MLIGLQEIKNPLVTFSETFAFTNHHHSCLLPKRACLSIFRSFVLLMITERLFCVKLWKGAVFFLKPGTAAHPEIHDEGEHENGSQSEVENWVGCPCFQIAERLEEIHPEIACQEGQRHEQH